ncbi:MAG TPA: MoaD/ThiS family protein [Terriglobia bacterium]|jgi:molybdopterin converting factor small subunit
MIVNLHLHTLLQRPSPNGLIRQLEVELPPGATLEELLTREGIVIDSENYLLVVNSRNVEPDQVLKDGDEVDLIPAISGG